MGPCDCGAPDCRECGPRQGYARCAEHGAMACETCALDVAQAQVDAAALFDKARELLGRLGPVTLTPVLSRESALVATVALRWDGLTAADMRAEYGRMLTIADEAGADYCVWRDHDEPRTAYAELSIGRPMSEAEIVAEERRRRDAPAPVAAVGGAR